MREGVSFENPARFGENCALANRKNHLSGGGDRGGRMNNGIKREFSR
jgi:hypothetical protein